MPTGQGDSLGEAILAAIAGAAGADRGYRSYDAKGWKAQLVKLTSQPRGYQAAADVGLSATSDTLRAWLSYAGPEDRAPSPRNQALIAQAYERMAGRWPADAIEGQDIRITGDVQIGSDRRTRGEQGREPFLIDGSRGSWDRIRELWESGEDIDPEDVEEYFTEDLVEADLGETTDQWEWPGWGYTVVIG